MTSYVLGSDDLEIARLDLQARSLDMATRRLLQASGIGPGMRVLDLGTGLGHVARAVADLVGDAGEVVGIDTSRRLLDVAAEQSAALPRVRFVEGDVTTWRDLEAFDAVVGRLILFHLPDPVATLRHHREALRPGGLVVALDYDLGTIRSEPPVPLITLNADRVLRAFRSAGADPVVGARLAGYLGAAGLTDVETFGIQDYLAPDDVRGPAMLCGVVRALAPQMAAAGIATSEELGLDTLTERVAAEMRACGAVMLPPALVGAWGRRR